MKDGCGAWKRCVGVRSLNEKRPSLRTISIRHLSIVLSGNISLVCVERQHAGLCVNQVKEARAGLSAKRTSSAGPNEYCELQVPRKAQSEE